jgi:hypothetical protein
MRKNPKIFCTKKKDRPVQNQKTRPADLQIGQPRIQIGPPTLSHRKPSRGSACAVYGLPATGATAYRRHAHCHAVGAYGSAKPGDFYNEAPRGGFPPCPPAFQAVTTSRIVGLKSQIAFLAANQLKFEITEKTRIRLFKKTVRFEPFTLHLFLMTSPFQQLEFFLKSITFIEKEAKHRAPAP